MSELEGFSELPKPTPSPRGTGPGRQSSQRQMWGWSPGLQPWVWSSPDWATMPSFLYTHLHFFSSQPPGFPTLNQPGQLMVMVTGGSEGVSPLPAPWEDCPIE